MNLSQETRDETTNQYIETEKRITVQPSIQGKIKMHCLEVILARNAAASAVSLTENQRLAKEGQFIIRFFPPDVQTLPDVNAGEQTVFDNSVFRGALSGPKPLVGEPGR